MFLLLSHMLIQNTKSIFIYIMKYVSGFIWKLGINFAVCIKWIDLMKQSVTVGVQLLWGGRYGCNNGRYGCTIVMSYIKINKVVSQWLLTFNLCVSIAGTLGCVFIDNETHESGVTKCTTGEAWSAFSWHHSSVFHCQWTHNQVFLLLSHMLI